MRWSLLVLCCAGCDQLFGILPVPAGADAPAPDVPPIDAAPPEVCTYTTAPVQVQFDANIAPHHDLNTTSSVAFVHALSGNARYAALTTTDGINFTYDNGPRDVGVTAIDPIRLDGDDTLNAIEGIGAGQIGISRYHFTGTEWDQVTPKPAELVLDKDARLGNVRDIGTMRYYVLSSVKTPGNPYHVIDLRTLDLTLTPPSLGADPKAAAINAAHDTAGAVLTRDGLTLIYSGRTLSPPTDFDIYISTRTALDQPFPVGTRVDALSTIGNDEREPWIDQTCDRLYFRRGAAIEVNGGVGSTFWLVNNTP